MCVPPGAVDLWDLHFFLVGGDWVIFVTVIDFPCAGGSPETAEVMERLKAQLSSF